ncbi:amidohydrolase family protein [Streptomyces bauhiniae]|uniref:amidohydrolase family protein n=1 Tax=Streptomyces bauhiniae TaxID=2340725 RepID=UPI001AC0004D|nr:amidohydrolase family protein [Streptomyces bauhiniae]
MSDVGGADHGMARALDEGLLPGPRLVFAGKALPQTGGHGDPRPLSEDGVPSVSASRTSPASPTARTPYAPPRAKMLLSGGVASLHDAVSAVQYTDDEIRAAVAEVTYEQLAEAGKRLGLGEASYRKMDDVRVAGLGALEKAHKAGVNLVIRSATPTTARLLRMEGRIGTLAVGVHADLLVVDGGPLGECLKHGIKAGTPA